MQEELSNRILLRVPATARFNKCTAVPAAWYRDLRRIAFCCAVEACANLVISPPLTEENKQSYPLRNPHNNVISFPFHRFLEVEDLLSAAFELLTSKYLQKLWKILEFHSLPRKIFWMQVQELHKLYVYWCIKSNGDSQFSKVEVAQFYTQKYSLMKIPCT